MVIIVFAKNMKYKENKYHKNKELHILNLDQISKSKDDNSIYDFTKN